ncbi:MAG: N-acetylmuramoyl-L-alanine amidase [Flavisolibacter sp.]|nr:N-acetylmuramoyl-L-alanine amidase [Flavisolibacter sp.]
MYRVMRGSLFIFLFGFIVSCNRNPYAATNRQYKKQVKAFAKTIRKTPPPDSVTTAIPWVGTINFNLRKPNFVVIHHTAQNSCEQTLKTFTVTQSQVSAHYVICKDGTIHHMLNDYLRAWHGGVGKWGNVTDVNSSSIGIELDNNGSEPFTEPQINSLLRLLDQLKRAYAIPVANFIGHSDIAPTRKVDPNVYFPWKQLADSGFGCWWSDTTNVIVPPQFDHLQALRIVGYDIKDSSAAIAAFKRKYLQQDNSLQLTEADKKILFTLYRRYQ